MQIKVIRATKTTKLMKMFFERETLYLNNEKHLVNPSRPAQF